ncbi:ribosomal RNA processing protein 1 B [Cryptosporidium felis]|nr:ribosomal RNA processing protein 1 B [Cryptosporidium felis]
MTNKRVSRSRTSENENDILLKLSRTLNSISSISRRKGLDIINGYISKHNSSITRLQILKIWKGLYYSMWLSDKVLIQREIAVNISQMQKKFEQKELWLLFIEEFYLMMRFRWDGMDYYRMDKFIFLQRTMLAESLEILGKKKFDNDLIEGLFDVYYRCLFVENIDSTSSNEYSALNEEHDGKVESIYSNTLPFRSYTGIGISLIFCKQFPQELIYLLFQQYKTLSTNFSINSCDHLNSLFNNYSGFIIKIIKSCPNHATLIDHVYNQLILKLLDSDTLLDDVLRDIEDLEIDCEERIKISEFLTKSIVTLMLELQSSLTLISKSNKSLISQTQRSRICSTLEKIEQYIKMNQNLISKSLPRVSRNKRKSSVSKPKIGMIENDSGEHTKRVRFDMSKNVRMLLPDSISTSRALLKIFDKKNNVKSNDELNCILFKSSNAPLCSSSYTCSNLDANPDNNSDSPKTIEILSVREALSKPSESKSFPSKSILKRRSF